MNIDEALAVINEAQRAFHERARKACEVFFERHGEYPLHIGISRERRIPLSEPVVTIALPDSYTRITVPFYKRYTNRAEDDVRLWHPNVGDVPISELEESQ